MAAIVLSLEQTALGGETKTNRGISWLNCPT
jgi:hypothetical protein